MWPPCESLNCLNNSSISSEDKNHQTVDIVTDDLAIQTDDEKDVQMDDEGIQTDTVNSSDDQTQTHSIESKDKETNTTTSTSFEVSTKGV